MERIADLVKEIEEKCTPETFAEIEPLLRELADKAAQGEAEAQSLRRQLAFFKGAINAQLNPIFIKNDELRYVFFNQSYKDFFKLEGDQHIGGRVTDLEYLSEEDRRRYQAEDAEMLSTLSVIKYEAVFYETGQGVSESMYWSRGFESQETGQRGVIGEIVDITHEKKLQRELKRQADILEQLMEEVKQSSKLDPGTKLHNRRILTEEVPAILEQAAAENWPVCGLLTDIDDFKYINDTYGHLAGDEILAKFADVMRGSLRQSDLAIRYGGDEFAAILVRVPLERAREVAERFRDNVAKKLTLPGGEPVTISVGVTEYRTGEDMLAFFERSDEALYAAKKSGKNKVVAL